MMYAHRNKQKTKEKRSAYANQGAREPKFGVEQAIMLKNKAQTNKLDGSYKGKFHIVEQLSP